MCALKYKKKHEETLNKVKQRMHIIDKNELSLEQTEKKKSRKYFKEVHITVYILTQIIHYYYCY